MQQLNIERRERDACGIGFVADSRGRASREILDAALEGLANVRHRGALAADRRTGDGAGVLLPIPAALVPGPWCGLAQVFLRDERARAEIEEACEREGIGSRRLATRSRSSRRRSERPRGRAAAHRAARAAPPVGLTRPRGRARAYRARRRAEAVAGAYVASLSFRTVTYKALCAADQLGASTPTCATLARRSRSHLPPALLDEHKPLLGARAAVPLALPQRRDQRDPGQRRAMRGRGGQLRARRGTALARARRGRLGLGNARQRARAARPRRPRRPSRGAMLVPPRVAGQRRARARGPRLPPPPRRARRAVGRARGLVFTDGRVVGAALDRNGLRPLRVATAGRASSPAPRRPARSARSTARGVRRGRLGPGQMLAVDPGRGLRGGRGDQAPPRAPAAVRALARGERRQVDPGAPSTRPRRTDRHGRRPPATRARSLTLLLRPIASDGHEPTYSMGDDTALPPLAGRARPLYLVLAPALRPGHEPADRPSARALADVPGDAARPPRASARGTTRAARLLELESFFLFPSALAELGGSALSTRLLERQSLAEACERIACAAVRRPKPAAR